MDDISVTPGTIRVKRFELPELEVALRDLPWFYREFLDSGGHLFDDDLSDEYSEDEYTAECLKQWIDGEQFVILWSKEYWMTGDGRVEST